MKEKTTSRVNDLIKESKTISNDVLKEALADMVKKERELEKGKLLQEFTSIKRDLDEAVQRLRNIRNTEKQQVKLVAKIDKAFTAFKEDGNYEAYYKAVTSR